MTVIEAKCFQVHLSMKSGCLSERVERKFTLVGTSFVKPNNEKETKDLIQSIKEAMSYMKGHGSREFLIIGYLITRHLTCGELSENSNGIKYQKLLSKRTFLSLTKEKKY